MLSKLREEHKQLEVLFQECKANLEVAERKIEEMEDEELQKSIESKDRKVDELEETLEDLKRDLEMKGDEVSLLIENLSTIEEDYGHFESRVYEILNKFQVAKNKVNETNTEKQKLKDELSVLIEQLRDKKEKELVLRERVRELEETFEDLKRDLEIKGDKVSLLIENLSTIEEDYCAYKILIEEQPGVQEEEKTKSYEDDDDFEFPCVCEDPMSADEIFYNSQIKPVLPIFGKDLLFYDVEKCKGEVNSSKPPTPSLIRIPEDHDPLSCSSSKADKLNRVPAKTYCVWKPKSDASAVVESLERCKKSSSTGIIKAVEVSRSSLPEQQRRQGHLRFFRSFECQFEEEEQQEGLRESNRSKSRRKSEADGGRRLSDGGAGGRSEAVVDAVQARFGRVLC